MLEISGGESYDIIRVTPVQFSQLLGQNAILDLTDLIKKYGGNITKVATPMGWSSVTKNGKRYGIPIEDGTASAEEPSGAVQNGLFIRTDLLAKYNLKMPTTPEELYNVMVAFKKEGYIPLTTFNTTINCIMSGFGLSGNEFVITNGKITSRLDSPDFKEYLTFMNKCYKEGLIDVDLPVNKMQNVQEKFINSKAAIMDINFWEIPSVEPALKKITPTAKVELMKPLKDKKGMMNLNVSSGSTTICVIPKTAKNVVAAMQYMNLCAEPNIFKQTYIGIEGIDYEIKNGDYYPILPAFNDFVNSKQFTGAAAPSWMYKLWGARARKTPEMAVAYESANKGLTAKNTNLQIIPVAYASSLPSFTKYKLNLDQMVKDYLMQLVAGGKPMSAYSDLQAQFKAQGGAKIVQDFNQWYNTSKIQILQTLKNK
jgi:putative aldouronate transport system substrate-binding protein